MIRASEEEMAVALTRPQPLIEKFTAAARKAVDDGASVIVPAPAFLATLAHRAGLRELDGALVLDTVSVAVKTAEMMAGLRPAGVTPSRRIGVYCRPDHALERHSYERIGEVFSIE